MFGISIDATLYPRRYFLVSLTVFVLLAVGVANLRRGRVGRRMLAVRNNERAAAALGINVVGVKLYAFVVAGIVAAAGGTLTVLAQSLPQFNNFDPLTGLSNLVDSVLGGIGYILGAVIGGLASNDGLPNAIINPLVMNWAWWANFFPLAIGVIVVLQLVKNPDGIADVIARGTPAKVKRPKGDVQTAVSGAQTGGVTSEGAAAPDAGASGYAVPAEGEVFGQSKGNAPTAGAINTGGALWHGKGAATAVDIGSRCVAAVGTLLPTTNRRMRTAKRQQRYVREVASAQHLLPEERRDAVGPSRHSQIRVGGRLGRCQHRRRSR